MRLDWEIDTGHRVARLGGASMVFHCHYYNCQLQEAVERGMGAKAAQTLTASATAAVLPQLRSLLGAQPEPGAALDAAADLFARLGFGTLSLDGLHAQGGEAVSPHSHYAMGWVATRGTRDTPACHFPSGFLAAAFAVAHGHDAAKVSVVETECFAMGADECRFQVEASR